MVITFSIASPDLVPLRVHEEPNLYAASAKLPQGAYTTFRTYHGNRLLRLEQHLQRLVETAELMGMPGRIDHEAARQALAEVMLQTGYAESRFRLTFSPQHLYASIEPFTPYPPEIVEQGVWCVTVSSRRDNPHAKSTAFIVSAGDTYKALPPGAHEGLMVAPDGSILEGLSSNFFAVYNGVLHTEQERALIGVTQTLVLEVSHRTLPELSYSSAAIGINDLPHIQECFITSVSREVMPVIKVDDREIGDGHPGPLTRRLSAALHDLIETEARSVFEPLA